MTFDKIKNWLKYHMMVARILVNHRKMSVTFRVHREFIPYLAKHMDQYRPAGVEFLYKRLRLWDYLFLRHQTIDVKEKNP